MTLITVPDELAFDSAEFDFIGGVQRAISRSGKTQRVVSPGAAWSLKFTLPVMKEAEARLWRSFVMAQGGGANEFLFGPPAYPGPSLYVGPAPVVNGLGQTGITLTCDGVTPSATVLKDGEYLAVGNELKVQIGDAISNALGQVTFTFEPMIRTSPLNNAPVEIFAPKGKFMLVDSAVGTSYSLRGFQNIKNISAVEVIT